MDGAKRFILFMMNRYIDKWKIYFFLFLFHFEDKIFLNDRSLRFANGVTLTGDQI